jgi:hypothetical protein
MKNDQSPFDRVRKILLGLGFVEKRVPGPSLLFEHSPSGTLLPYRDHQPGDSMSWHELTMTRTQLDGRGLMEADDFEEQLHQTPV